MRYVFVLLIAAFIGAPCAWADEPAKAPPGDAPTLARAQKIGFVDITRVWSQYRRRGDFDKELRALRLDLSDQDRSRADQVTRFDKEIEQLAMGTPDRLALEEKRKAAAKEADESRRKSQDELNRRYIGMVNEVSADLARETEAVAKEGNFDMVLKDQSPESEVATPAEAVFQIAQRVVLYSKLEYDLTDSVIKRLNDKYSSEPKKEKAAPEPAKQPEPPAKER